jgi:hypothetical protein
MLTFRNQLKEVTAVAAGKTAIINCPVGDRYHKIVLVTGDTASGATTAPTISAIVSEIRVNIGGKVIRRFTPTELDIINTAMGAKFASQAYVGAVNGAGRRHIPIFFAEPWRKRVIDQDALALQTGYLGSKGKLQVEVDLKSGITPFLTAFALTDKLDSGKPNNVMKFFPFDVNAAATPIELSGGLDRQELWSQISFFDTSDAKTVDRVRLVSDSIELHDLSKDENTSHLVGVDMNPAAGAYHVVFDHDDTLDDLLPAADSKGIQASLTLSAAPSGTLRYIIQRVGLPNA